MASYTERYHEFTKYNPYTIDKLGPANWFDRPEPFRRPIDALPLTELAPLVNLDSNLEDAVNSPLHNLARFFYLTAGVTALAQNETESTPLRSNPSAGGLYPLEVYFSTRLPGLNSQALYQFFPLHLAVQAVGDTSLYKTELFEPSLMQSAHTMIIITGLFGRSSWRYKERAYRRILLDCGHWVGNALHAAHLSAWHGGVVSTFCDDSLSRFLSLDAEQEFPIVGLALSDASLDYSCSLAAGPTPAQAAAHLPKHHSLQWKQNCVERLPAQFDHTALPAKPMPSKASTKSILQRRSTRRFIPKNMPYDVVQLILKTTLRMPGLHLAGLLNLHLVVHSVDSLEPGVYDVQDDGSLLVRFSAPLREAMCEAALGQELARDCSAVLIYSAQLSDATQAWGDRAYRYLCMDCGLMGQTMALQSEALGYGSSGIGGYYDDLCNETLQLPPAEAILYVTCLGVPEKIPSM
jgi:SagB-type dehydrogenase family enzyme